MENVKMTAEKWLELVYENHEKIYDAGVKAHRLAADAPNGFAICVFIRDDGKITVQAVGPNEALQGERDGYMMEVVAIRAYDATDGLSEQDIREALELPDDADVCTREVYSALADIVSENNAHEDVSNQIANTIERLIDIAYDEEE